MTKKIVIKNTIWLFFDLLKNNKRKKIITSKEIEKFNSNDLQKAYSRNFDTQTVKSSPIIQFILNWVEISSYLRVESGEYQVNEFIHDRSRGNKKHPVVIKFFKTHSNPKIIIIN